MSSNVDQQHMLSLIDTLHEKYQFQDGEYKEFVEALGGKKKPLDVENAKIVRITYEKLDANLCVTENQQDEDCDWHAELAFVPYSTIREVLQVAPISERDWRLGLVPKIQLDTTCTTVQSTTLKALSESMTTPHPYYHMDFDKKLRITDIEVLVTRA